MAVLLVLFDHTLKFLGFEHLGSTPIDWAGRIGVAFFFVHTSLVLMLSLERSKLARRVAVSAELLHPKNLSPLSLELFFHSVDLACPHPASEHPPIRVLRHEYYAKGAIREFDADSKSFRCRRRDGTVVEPTD